MKTALQEKMVRAGRLVVMVVAMACALTTTLAEAQFGGPAKEVNFSAVILPATDKLPARLAITATIDDGWHIYSITQAKGGPRPTKFSFDASGDFEIAGDFTPDKPPKVHVYQDIWPDLNVEEHHGTVVWTAPLKFAAGVNPAGVEITGSVKGQVCNDEQCNNFKKAISAETE